MNTKLQLRVLYRHFLFRLMDVELLSESARGDASVLLGQFGALLVFGSVVLSLAAVSLGMMIRRAATADPVWNMERFLVSITMLAVGMFAVLSWDSVFPDRRDVMVLAPLPVRARTVLAAKIAASATSLLLIVATMHCLAGFVWPLVLAPAGSGLAAAARFIAAFWIAVTAAGAFLYCAILGVQAIAAQLPRRLYLRISSVLQISVLALMLGTFLLQPSVRGAAALGAPENQFTLAWLPPYWFMGLFSELSGGFPSESHGVMAPLARRALAGLAAAIFLAGAAFLLSYYRTMRKIVEEPDAVPGPRGGLWLPRFGSGPQTALAHFVIRGLLRSRRHRVLLAFYLGGGIAVATVYLGAAGEKMPVTGVPMMAASLLLLFASVLGTRVLFSQPLDLRANWLFRVTPMPEGAGRLSATRRALLAFSVLPVVTVAAAALLCFSPCSRAAQHVLVLALLGSLLVDLSLQGFRKIPFTCSYLPGKSRVHILFWFGIVPAVMGVHQLVEWERLAMASALSYTAMAAVLGGLAFAARRAADRSANRSGPEIRFEEASDELITLRL